MCVKRMAKHVKSAAIGENWPKFQSNISGNNVVLTFFVKNFTKSTIVTKITIKNPPAPPFWPVELGSPAPPPTGRVLLAKKRGP